GVDVVTLAGQRGVLGPGELRVPDGPGGRAVVVAARVIVVVAVDVAVVVVDVHVGVAAVPAAPATAAMPAPRRRGGDGAKCHAEAESGEDPRAITGRVNAIGRGRRIPDGADPRRVHVAGAIDHEVTRRHDHPVVPGRVSRVDHLGRRAVDVDVR